MYFVYILRHTTTGRLYVGSCSDLSRRLAEHQRNGKSAFRLVYQEMRPSKADALKRELYLKPGNGRRTLKNLLPSQEQLELQTVRSNF